MGKRIRSEETPAYGAGNALTPDEQGTINAALDIIQARMRRSGEVLASPEDARHLARLTLGLDEEEVFAAMFLDNRHRLIAYDRMFFGTIDGATVHPRVVVKRALGHNAAAVILSHNHPSGVADPSRADELLTRRLRDALATVDVRVLDHLVVGADEVVSLAERGLL